MQTTAVEIVPASAGAWPALAGLFEEGGDPSWCWCSFFRLRASAFSGTSVAEHRELLHGLTERPIPPGLVALEPDGRAVGWVSLGPREDFDRLRYSRILTPVDDTPVWTIVCFVVARRRRRSGLMRHLLDAAVAFARDRGALAVEAYPVDRNAGRPTAPTLYSGSLATFRSAGFEVVRPVSSPTATVMRTIVRLDLRTTTDTDRQRLTAPSEPA